MKRAVVDIDTGEVLIELGKEYKVVKKKNTTNIIKNIMKKNDDGIELSDEDMANLYSYLRATNEINKYNQIKINGRFISTEYIKLMSENKKYSHALALIISNISSHSNCVKLTQTSLMSKITQLYELCSIHPRDRKEFKSLITDNDVIRVFTMIDSKTNKPIKKLVVNPTIIRDGSHTSIISIMAFKDVTVSKINECTTLYLSKLALI